jgi:hypothetical protein
MLVGDSLARPRQRRIEPGDLLRRAIGVANDIAEFANLVLHFSQRPRHREFGEMQPLGFQQLPRRALVEQVREDDVGLEHQHIFRTARQTWIPADIAGHPDIAGESGKPQYLFGVGQGQQQLIAADIHRHDARQIG